MTVREQSLRLAEVSAYRILSVPKPRPSRACICVRRNPKTPVARHRKSCPQYRGRK